MQILILTDKSINIGMGHYTRMSAMASALIGLGCEVEMLVNGGCSDLRENEKCIDWKLLDTAQFSSRDLIIIDSYLYTQIFLDKLIQDSKKVLVIDDLERLSYHGCIVLNPNLFGETLEYLDCKDAVVLKGASYCLLREAFLLEPKLTYNEVVSNVFVTFGGTDPFYNSLEMMEKIPENSSNVFTFALGLGTDEELKRRMLSAAKLNEKVIVKIGLTALEMREEIEKSDVVISASGQTVSEIIRLMKPAFFVKVVENQQLNYDFIEKSGTGIPVSKVSEIELNNLSLLKKRMQLMNSMSTYSSKMRTMKEIVAEILQTISDEKIIIS